LRLSRCGQEHLTARGNVLDNDVIFEVVEVDADTFVRPSMQATRLKL
jgi:hypothetical protein